MTEVKFSVENLARPLVQVVPQLKILIRKNGDFTFSLLTLHFSLFPAFLYRGFLDVISNCEEVFRPPPVADAGRKEREALNEQLLTATREVVDGLRLPQPTLRTEKDIGSENPETTTVSGFFMSFFKVEFKRYHFPKTTFGEDFN